MTEVGNLKQKLDDIDNLLVDAAQSYHTPSRFFTYSSAAIQAIRTFTLAVQSNKDNVPDFEAWYDQWQGNMKSDPRMKWLHDKRNEVAHTDALSSESYATIFTVSDYRRAKIEEHFDYRTSNEELIAKAQQMVTNSPELTHTTIAIGRKYVVSIAGQPQELLQLLFYGYIYLRYLYADLKVYLESGRIDKIPDDLSSIVEQESVIDDWYRYFTFKAAGGQPVNETSILIERDDKVIKELVKEYGKPPEKLSNDTAIRDAASIAFNLAKRIIKHGDSLLPTVYMQVPDGYQPLNVAFKDRAEKLKFAFDLPGLLEQHQASGVIFVGEVWTMDMDRGLKRLSKGKSVDRARKKSECLWLTMLTKDLETLDMVATIQRTEKGVEFGKTKISVPTPESLNFLRPVYLWWLKLAP